jgi:hypothetical protein
MVICIEQEMKPELVIMPLVLNDDDDYRSSYGACFSVLSIYQHISGRTE